MEGGGYSFDDDKGPVVPIMEEEEVAGPSSNKRSKREPSPTPPPAPTSAKLLLVEKAKDPLAPIGYLNPPGTKDKTKRKLVTATSSAREDDDFEPVPWYYFPEEDEMQMENEDSGVIYVRQGVLAEEFKVRYTTSESRTGKISLDKGVHLIKKTILQLVGKDSPSSLHELDIEESSPELIFTQEEEGLSDDERELLFTKIFAAGGRVPVTDKPDWNLIIHRAPTTGIIHLCLERKTERYEETRYIAYRLCTKRDCYQINTSE